MPRIDCTAASVKPNALSVPLFQPNTAEPDAPESRTTCVLHCPTCHLMYYVGHGCTNCGYGQDYAREISD